MRCDDNTVTMSINTYNKLFWIKDLIDGGTSSMKSITNNVKKSYKINNAKEMVKNDELSDGELLCAFDIIGRDYLEGEMGCLNDLEGLTEIVTEFELTIEQLLAFLYDNPDYNPKDKYVSCDGLSLVSFRNIKYFKNLVYKKMNGECAEFVLGCDEIGAYEGRV